MRGSSTVSTTGLPGSVCTGDQKTPYQHPDPGQPGGSSRVWYGGLPREGCPRKGTRLRTSGWEVAARCGLSALRSTAAIDWFLWANR
jgi:hypothetical protein